jgi:hypothetical protein
MGNGSFPTRYSPYFAIDAADASSCPHVPDSPMPVMPASVLTRT